MRHYIPRSEILAMVLAGGRVHELAALTVHRPKSAMPFGGMYRVIDCALSNLMNTGIERIGILSQYRPSSLMDHVGSGRSWDLVGSTRGIRFLPPHTGESDSDWYKGTADALYQNLAYIHHYRPEKVLVLSGDHIYRMNYDPILELHERKKADLTIAVTPVHPDHATQFGLVQLDDAQRVVDYQEKPAQPISSLASMTVYLFETDVLIRELKKNARDGRTFHIYDEILPGLVRQGNVFAYVHQGYWAYSRSIQEYYRANMDCVGLSAPIDLTTWRLRTNHDARRIGDPPPILTGKNTHIENAVIAPGCRIMGTVKQSVLSPLVMVDAGAVVEDSIVFEGVHIHSGCHIRHAIIDKSVTIGSGCTIGEPIGPMVSGNDMFPRLLNTGLTVIGKDAQIPEKMSIGQNVLIYPGCDLSDASDRQVPDGSCLGLESGED